MVAKKTIPWFFPWFSLSKKKNLIGDFNPSEKYAKVSWDDFSQHMESHKILPWGWTKAVSSTHLHFFGF